MIIRPEAEADVADAQEWYERQRQGLRQDLAKQFADRLLETTAQVLARHIQSAEEVSAIMREIRGGAVG